MAATTALAAHVPPVVDHLAAETEAEAGLLVLMRQGRQAMKASMPQQAQEDILHHVFSSVRVAAEK